MFRVGFRVFRVGSGCSGWGSGCSVWVPGVPGGVPAFTDTPFSWSDNVFQIYRQLGYNLHHKFTVSDAHRLPCEYT